jgi:hypothetical protein
VTVLRCASRPTCRTARPIGAYRPVATSSPSPRLDYLLWRYLGDGATGALDRDTAVALAALAWYETGAVRRGGGAVWADPSRGFATITPLAPTPWSALPRLSSAQPVGLRAGGTDLDAAERRVHALHLESIARRGPWSLSTPTVSDTGLGVRLTGPGGSVAGRPLRFEVRAGDVVLADLVVLTDTDGWARIDRPRSAPGDVVTVEVSGIGPGARQDWDGSGAVQRMATPTSATLRATTTLPTAPTSTTTTTTASATTTSTSVAPPVTTIAVIAPPPSTTPPSTTPPSTTTTSTTTTEPAPPSTETAPTTTLVLPVVAPTVPPADTTTASTTSVPTTTLSTTTTTTTTTAVVTEPIVPLPPSPVSPAPRLPRTGPGLAGRAADAAAVLVTLGLVLLAAGTGAVARRHRPEEDGSK